MFRYLLATALLVPSTALADRYGFSVAASDSLSTTVSCEELKAVSGTDTNSQNVPNRARLGVLAGKVTSISSAASVVWFVALDSAGEVPITDQVTVSILDEDSDNAGGVASVLDVPYALTSESTQGSLWVCAKTDAGTATIVSRLFWQVEQ